MARIRSVHPSLFTDEAWVSCSPFARILYIGLMTEADDQGLFEWKPLQIRMRLLPGDNADVAALLAELEGANLISQLESGGKKLGAIRYFRRFQRPKKPNAMFVLPPEWGTYVGLSDGSSELDDDEPPPVPPKGEPVPPKSEIPPQMEDGGGRMEEIADAAASVVPVARGPQVWDDVFSAAWEAYPKLGRDRSMSRAKCWQLWRQAAGQAGSPEKLLAAVRRYVAEDKTHKGDCGPPAFDRWLRAGRWEHFLAGEASPRIVTVFPDQEIRTAVIAAKGEGWANSWLDPCGWEPTQRVILPRNGLAAQKLRSEVQRVLSAQRATIEELAA